MKVKDFIDRIRPITTLNPESDLFLQDSDFKRYDVHLIMIDEKSVEIRLK